MFATDRDLWILEPRLFDDIAFSAQTRLLNQPCTVASGSTELVFSAADLLALDLRPGMVIALASFGRFEIVQTISATTLAVSRLRPSSDAPAIPIPAPDATQTTATVLSFAPQIDLAHRGLLALLAVEPGAAPADPPPGAVYASQITNPASLARAEALGALHLIYSAASALAPVGVTSADRATMYSRRAAGERSRISAHIDLDNDGLPDITRSPSTARLHRA